MATEGIEKYIDRSLPLTAKAFSEFAIPCFPNFTIIPKDKSGVVLDTKMEVNENNLAEMSQAKQDIIFHSVRRFKIQRLNWQIGR